MNATPVHHKFLRRHNNSETWVHSAYIHIETPIVFGHILLKVDENKISS